MGNHKFRLSDMLPTSWFYKLKDMGTKRAKTHPKKLPPITTTSAAIITSPPQPHHHPRQSYHFSRDESTPGPLHNNLSPILIPAPPRKSAKKRRSTSKKTTKKSSPRLVTSSVSADCSCSRASIESIWTKPDSATVALPISITSSENESLFPEIGSDHGSLDTPCNFINPLNDTAPKEKSKKFKTLNLPPVITKKTEPNQIKRTSTNRSMSVKVLEEDIVAISHKEQRTSPLRKYSPGSPGMKLRTNSPRIGTRKVHFSHRKSLSGTSTSRRNDSFAVVKSSKDPKREFKESMVEMIIENNIKTSKELEELLACYLSLNSDEYHHIIIEVFKQIWFDTTDIRLSALSPINLTCSHLENLVNQAMCAMFPS